MIYQRTTLLMLAVLLMSLAGGMAQDKELQVASATTFSGTYSIFQQQLSALGNRTKSKGMEKTVFAGLLFDAAGNVSAVQVVYQLPNWVKLEGFKPKGEALSFDGDKEYGVTLGSKDEALLEAFVSDFVEGMLESVKKGAAVRLIGRAFKPDTKLNPKYDGPRYDIYQISSPVLCSLDRMFRSKLYYFDHKTGLLQSVRYGDRSLDPPVQVETRFSMWGYIDGSAYPARIDYFNDGKLVFSFIAESIKGEAAADKESYR